MSRQLHPRIAVLALSVTFGTAAPAVAPDLQVDPDSPAGTEYHLPTDRAREETRSGVSAAGSSGTDPSDDTAVRRGRRGQEGRLGRQSRNGQRSRHDGGGRGRLRTSSSETVRAQAPDGGGDLVAVVGGAGGVLVLGELAGLAWRSAQR